MFSLANLIDIIKKIVEFLIILNLLGFTTQLSAIQNKLEEIKRLLEKIAENKKTD